MNERILHIIKFPDSLKASDIGELRREISNYPYVQPIRALFLMALHQFQPEAYQKELALTAAYTTDKKILYQLINPVSHQQEQIAEVPVQKATAELTVAVEEPEEIEVDEGTTEFEKEAALEEEIEKIASEDVESVAIAQDSEEENIINVIKETDPTEEDYLSAQTSFAGADNFLPDVKFSIPDNHTEYAKEKKPSAVPGFQHSFVTTITQPIITDTSASAEEYKEEEKHIDHSTLDFADNTHFDFLSRPAEENVSSGISDKVEIQEPEDINAAEDTVEENIPVIINEALEEESVIADIPEPVANLNDDWKPMSFDAHIPDALIGKSVTQVIDEKLPEPELKEEIIPEPEVTEAHEEASAAEEVVENKIIEEVSATESSERPVINYSFFGTAGTDKEREEVKPEAVTEEPQDSNEEKMEEEIMTETKQETIVTSNVSSFINTWQNWLHKEKPENVDVERKNKAIEKFIENNPRISALKDESDYVIKDKGDDISHLMTETLANLYLGQRLYNKSINAFEILQKKFPEKKKEFQEKINYIKDLKSGKIQQED
ncbi:hypothetical protein HZQ23_11355 [Elizabethkingia anophelis]|uniref:hypothetical protein n=1 Tax=Elizabethkingia anophelis TaxID=1117645 RepID=UPI0020B3C4E5|nr:hypothetical protein [Elizabethkingia anophelis]MCT3991602.1 hypothetical protein [Elizabethkingia anophelis]MCT4009505.1 hypothetical protein [Elizabethkingia anophelis]MDV4143010.1 hypothetical protein [Elizabethkingia anophelis]UTF98302.1 hypothetical protein J2N94_08600 [Elizabethkingia anophelis]